MHHSEAHFQTSETFLLSAVLALSGGFQDAYTYNVRDEVFSNAQTGNIVLMSQHLMEGDWMTALHYLFPLLAFALGVFVAEQIGHRYKTSTRLHWRQIVVAIEFVLLLLVGFIPTQYNIIATALVSFACSMQVQTFRKVHGYGYASTMCIGNLRSGMDALVAFGHTRDKQLLWKSLHYFAIIFIFALGAGVGAQCIALLGAKTIWLSCALLVVSLCFMFIREDLPELETELKK